MRTQRERKGFTLIELLTVVAIIGILVAIAVPAYLGQRQKAMQAEAFKNLEDVRLQQEQYRAEFGEYANKDAGGGGTITGVAAIQALLPGFRPGDPNALFFDYSFSFTVADGMTTGFTARAVGKAGTPVDSSVFTIDQDNIKSW